MAILDDFTINTTLKTIRHTSGTVVYSVNALYSAVKDFEDDAGNMDDEVIMTAQTPLEYSIINGWFIDNPSTNFLNGGAISSIGYLTEIQRVVTTAAGTSPVGSDIGLNVVATGGSGPLLHFDIDENDDGTLVNVWYVRTGAGADLSSTIEVTTAGGTGTQTVSTSADGEEVWANVFSFGTITATVSPQFYIEQELNSADHRIIEWVGNTNFSRGNMDVLIRTQIEGVLIDSGDMLITVRQPGTSYDSSEQTLAAGGRNPFALNAADDADNLLTEYYLLFDGEAGTDIVVGDTITADSKAWYAEVIEVAYFTDTTTGYLGLRGLNESIDIVADNDAFTSSGSGTADANGTPGSRVIAYDNEASGPFTVGNVISGGTSLTKARIKGLEDNGTDGYLCLGPDALTATIDFREDSTYYNTIVDNEVLTEGSATGDSNLLTTGDFLDKQLATSGMIGKVEFVFTHGSIGTSSSDLQVGDHVTVTAGGSGTGIVTRVNGSTIFFGNTSNDFASGDTIDDDDSARTATTNTAWTDSHLVARAFVQSSNNDYDLIVFLEGETVQRGYEFAKLRNGDGSEFQFEKLDLTGASEIRVPVDGQFYLSAYFDLDTPSNTYDKIGKRAAPVGNFAGGTWFGARGVWFEDVNGSDANALILIDSTGVTRTPPIQVQVTQANTISGDRVFVVEDDGSGKTDKTTYNSHASNNTIGISTFEVDGTPAIRADTPSTGVVRVVDDDGSTAQTKEHRYRYDSFTGSIFTLTTNAEFDGTTTSAGGLVLNDTGAAFGDGVSGPVIIGDMIRNVTDGSIGFVESVTATAITMKQLEGGGSNDWQSGETYEINQLTVAYVAADTAYVPYIDRPATSTSESVTVVFATNRNLIGKARNKGVIFAFVGTGNLTNAGATITTVRNADGIAT